LGEKNSTKRTAQQTEDARFWLTIGPLSTHSLERQIVIGESMSVLNSARFMAMVSVAEADAIQSVYEAKSYYNFWRPITAIRNGDMGSNPETERMPTWQPIDVTPKPMTTASSTAWSQSCSQPLMRRVRPTSRSG
jgi:hypothetical protein